MGEDLPSGSQRVRRTVIVAFLAMGTLASIAMIGESLRSWQPKIEPLPRSPADPSTSSVSGQERIADYLGPAACLECHPGESALQGRSGHSRTLRTRRAQPHHRRG